MTLCHFIMYCCGLIELYLVRHINASRLQAFLSIRKPISLLLHEGPSVHLLCPTSFLFASVNQSWNCKIFCTLYGVLFSVLAIGSCIFYMTWHTRSRSWWNFLFLYSPLGLDSQKRPNEEDAWKLLWFWKCGVGLQAVRVPRGLEASADVLCNLVVPPDRHQVWKWGSFGTILLNIVTFSWILFW